MLNVWQTPLVFAEPHHLIPSSSWLGHIPFAFALIEWHRPRVLVELGTYTGASYFAFCQAVSALSLSTRCFAVDTWRGDDHVGFYGEEVFEEVRRRHDESYGGFSRLLRMTFDEALDHISDGAVDLLHIDGCHHYEAVRHDFHTWLPKMSARGVVLLHDTQVKENHFGVWRLLEELKAKHPVFEFLHCYGLGVVAVGERVMTEPVAELFRAEGAEIASFQRFFAALGSRLMLQGELVQARRQAAGRISDLTIQNKVLQEQQSALITSVSWRLTRPLRAIRRWLPR